MLGLPSVVAMLTAITITQIYVPDQDQALDFYVGKLGFEVQSDVDFGPMRWLTVNLPGQPAPSCWRSPARRG